MTSFKELQPFSFRMEQSVFLYSNKCSKPWKILSTRITRELREHDFVEENPSTLWFQPFGHSASRKRCFEPTCLWNTDSVLQFSTYCIYSGWNINLALFPINLTSGKTPHLPEVSKQTTPGILRCSSFSSGNPLVFFGWKLPVLSQSTLRWHVVGCTHKAGGHTSGRGQILSSNVSRERVSRHQRGKLEPQQFVHFICNYTVLLMVQKIRRENPGIYKTL